MKLLSSYSFHKAIKSKQAVCPCSFKIVINNKWGIAMPYEIPNEKLLLERMPKPEQEIMELTKFALTFDGYKYWGQDCGEIASLVGTYYDEHGYLPDSPRVSFLCTTLFEKC
ncbi:hypothetical protein [Paenibacillus aestuarii]|uniref:Phage protein n=1 Tax=Paenibacillus aestuarii TaxID=516965 RepID=A0ABW0KFB2_9BACL|nr:hypothetical protein [Paenibacillus aestuarii]